MATLKDRYCSELLDLAAAMGRMVEACETAIATLDYGIANTTKPANVERRHKKLLSDYADRVRREADSVTRIALQQQSANQ